MLHVTPYVGVWIEIMMNERTLKILEVTPYVGVWIEISVCGYFYT